MESLKLLIVPELSGTEEGRRPTVVHDNAPTKPDSEVIARPHRRNLTVSYKLKVLETVAFLREQGQGAVGAYLRKEGLYFSSIRYWERMREQGLLGSTQRGHKKKNHDAILAENKQLRRKLDQSRKRLAKTELIIELQKKLLAIMDLDDLSSTERSDVK